MRTMIKNSKSEYRNPKQIQNFNVQISKQFKCFRIWNFEFKNCFGFRISDFEFRKKWGQVTLEFTFSMVLVLLLMYGVVRVMGWLALTLAERRVAHDFSLTARTDVENWRNIYRDPSPLLQLQPEFYATNKLKLVFNNW